VALRYTQLLSLEVFDAFFAIQSVYSPIRILPEGMRQLANFDPAHLIDCCQLIFEFVRSQAVMTSEQARAKQLTAELEDAQVRIRTGQQGIEQLKKASEQLREQLAEDSVDQDDFPADSRAKKPT
jgi:hypothetical protein